MMNLKRFAALAALLAGVAHGEAVLLAKLDVTPWQRREVVTSGIPVYWDLGRPVFLPLSADGVWDCQARGWPLEVLDSTAVAGEYFLVYKAGVGEMSVPGRLLWQNDRLSLVRLAWEDALAAKAAGFEMIRFPAAPHPLASEPDGEGGPTFAADTLIQQLMGRVSQDTLGRDIRSLQGFVTRYTYRRQCDSAARWLHARFTDMGLPAAYDTYVPSGDTSYNVEATLTGAVHPESVVIACAHFDSYSSNLNLAPGADDNATGTAALLELARVMKNAKFRWTVKFLEFSGEEQWMLGSTHWVDYKAVPQNMRIAGVYNLDMFGFTAADTGRLVMNTNTASRSLANLADSCNGWYGIGLRVLNYLDEDCAGDNTPFWQRGYKAVFALEDSEWGIWRGSNPHYHTPHDTFGFVRMSLVRRTTQLTLACLATLAGICTDDVGVTHLVAPTGTFDSGATITPACSLYNFGNLPENYSLRMRIGSYDRTASVSSHAPGTRVYVTFPVWTAGPRGSIAVSCSTELTGDMVPANNRLTGTVNVNVTDVGCSHLVVPSGSIDSGATVTPACSVRNLGTTTPTSYTARLRIGTGYNQQTTVTSHAPGAITGITFPAWTAGVPRGSYAVSCSTELATDQQQGNDKLTSAVNMQVHDVGTTIIVAPAGSVPIGSSVAPACTVRNFGTTTEGYTVRMKVGAGYNQTASVAGHAAGTMVYVTFPSWTAGPGGNQTVSCSTELATDQQKPNDKATGSVAVTGGVVGGWSEKSAMPTAPSGKYMKDGGWLAHNSGNNLIYAGKGNKAGDFYSYDPDADVWTPLALIPSGIEAKPPYKGAAGCVDGNGVVYATKGNNTPGFYKYTAATDSWRQLTNAPLGLSNKKVKGGTDLQYVMRGDTGFVYLLKGYKNEFYRYNTDKDTWQSLPDAPGTLNVKWNVGSWLAYDGTGKLYGHQAKYHGHYAFDVTTGTWGAALKGMPYLSRSGKNKKSNAGGCGVFGPGGTDIYALKGGNTQEFWQYFVTGDSWQELETIPAYGSTLKKKKVKAGAALVADNDGVLYATKGNKCNEMWRYQPTAYCLQFTAPNRDGVLARAAVSSQQPVFSVSPNPMRAGFAVVRFSSLTARHAPLAITIFDASGRLVLRSSLPGLGHDPNSPGAIRSCPAPIPLDLRGLRAGVYIVRLNAGACSATQKLVIER